MRKDPSDDCPHRRHRFIRCRDLAVVSLHQGCCRLTSMRAKDLRSLDLLNPVSLLSSERTYYSRGLPADLRMGLTHSRARSLVSRPAQKLFAFSTAGLLASSWKQHIRFSVNITNIPSAAFALKASAQPLLSMLGTEPPIATPWPTWTFLYACVVAANRRWWYAGRSLR